MGEIDIVTLALAGLQTEPKERLRLTKEACPDYDSAIYALAMSLDSKERGYRRGYDHAVSEIMDYLGGKVSPRIAADLNDFSDRVEAWRCGPLEKGCAPPRIRALKLTDGR